ncbi:MAG TPA: hydroxymethylbilane synthase, partial [Xanthomonadales bacterium]|nr:hydroxymethylbilane synthase [Xanthomonadales bacterium]
MYPVALSVRGRRVVVVGGGAVAERKVRGLLGAEPDVVVISPTLTPPLAALADVGAIAWEPRRYAPGDLTGAFIAFAATDDDATNAAIAADARAAGILVNDASDVERGDFATPAVHRSGPLTVSVDSGGLSPSFTKRIRDELALQFDARYARAAATLGALRERVQIVVPPEQRAALMKHFAERDVDELATMKAGAIEHEVERAADTLAGVVPAQTEPLVCATRASLLAMTQARTVMSVLAKAGLPSTVLEVTTRGDAVQDRSIAAIGTDNVFVKELELALREGRADYAVHSCKDLPSTLSEDMTLAAVTAREDARDAYCSERYPAFADLPAGARVGTSSPRRRAQLRALRPDLVYDDVRGNVDTRLRKLRDGDYAAIVLAAAGLNRLGVRATHTVPFAVDVVTPAVGQGALGIETRAGDGLAGRLDAIVGDPQTSIAVRAERAFLRTVH